MHKKLAVGILRKLWNENFKKIHDGKFFYFDVICVDLSKKTEMLNINYTQIQNNNFKRFQCTFFID